MADENDPAKDSPASDDNRKTLHDLKGSLHVIGLGLVALRESRTDETLFEELCDALESESRKAFELVRQFEERVLDGSRE